MRHLRVLEDCGGAGFGQRLGEVSEVVAGLLPTAEGYPGGKEVVVAVQDTPKRDAHHTTCIGC